MPTIQESRAYNSIPEMNASLIQIAHHLAIANKLKELEMEIRINSMAPLAAASEVEEWHRRLAEIAMR